MHELKQILDSFRSKKRLQYFLLFSLLLQLFLINNVQTLWTDVFRKSNLVEPTKWAGLCGWLVFFILCILEQTTLRKGYLKTVFLITEIIGFQLLG